MSTMDVANGMRAGLLAAGHTIADYRLHRRWKLAYAGFLPFTPEGMAPDESMVARHAAEALVHQAILNRSEWVYVVSGMGLHPEALLACRRVGIRVAIHFTEAPYNSDPERELYLARLADVAFVNERTSVSDFQRVLDHLGNGGQAHYLPHAYDPAVHHPDASADSVPDDERADVLLVGTGFAERCWLLEGIDWTGIKLRVLGIWPGVKSPSHLYASIRDGAIRNHHTAAMYRAAKIILNPHRYHETAESANPRTFEAAACGAFQISDQRAEIAELLGDAVPMYQPGVPWQLAALVRRWLADDAGRAQLAERARQRIAGQTFEARARTVTAALDEWDREHSRTGRLSVIPDREVPHVV